jgi:hypothetical protein
MRIEVTRGKLLAVALAALEVVLLTVSELPLAERPRFAAIVSLVLIWFPDEIGGITGVLYGRKLVDRESPGWAVTLVGWLGLLVFVPVYWYVLSFGR